ncbi:MAG: transcriptional regulator NrdR [Fimbriimonadaceae bacterium]|nr:transcriptional regulator NrdR [Fimbriimonadaceae bacterium]
MTCPFCGHEEHKVLDSRPARDGTAIRRRRECEACGRRFTTFEEVERPRLVVVKRSGAREEFDREKLVRSISLACRKRPVGVDAVRAVVARVEREAYDRGDAEIGSAQLGENVLEELLDLDKVAFVRFASVYREFDDPAQFAEIVRSIKPRAKRARGNLDAVVTS